LAVALTLGLLLAVVAPVMAEAGPGQASAVPAGAGVPRVDWTACGDRLECASVPVPLDWDEPNGPRIALSVIRRLASRPDQRIGSLFVNPGGPGDSGVGYVAERGPALDALTRGRFDIVGWDIRGGAGASAPVTCFADAGERAAFWEGLPVPTTTHDGYGHLSRRDPSTCVVQATGSYLVDLSVPARGTTCPSDRLPFDPDFGQPVPPTP
jgi:pimeloyl-ACP methyl ester carboxylesterase